MHVEQPGSTPVHVDPSNAEQLAAWDGDEGDYWARHAERFDRSIAMHYRPFLHSAALADGDRILDIGCGTGEATCDAARASSSGSALGIDLSSSMLAHGRRRAAAQGLTNVSFVQGDAQVHPFDPQRFTVALARTSAMFFGDHIAAFRNIRRALAPSGRLVLLTWQPLPHNEWLQEIATSLALNREPRLPPPGAGPLSLSEPDRVRELLGASGYTGVHLEGNRAPMWFGEDSDTALEFILGLAGWMIEDLDEHGKTAARNALAASIAEHDGDAGVTFDSATWIITARADDR